MTLNTFLYVFYKFRAGSRALVIFRFEGLLARSFHKWYCVLLSEEKCLVVPLFEQLADGDQCLNLLAPLRVAKR